VINSFNEPLPERYRTKTLETARLTLRRPTTDDFADFTEYYEGDFPIESAFNNIANAELTWVIELTGKVIGEIFLTEVYPPDSAKVGYVLNKEYRGSGFATESLNAVLDFAFGHLQLFEVRAVTETNNTPSIELLGRCGFVRNAADKDILYYTAVNVNG
jgi:RimJ/RimL family protein N-acetyltransferase